MSFFTALGLIFLAFLAWVFAVAVRRDRRRAGLSEEGRRIQERAVRDARDARRELRSRKGMDAGGIGPIVRALRDRD